MDRRQYILQQIRNGRALQVGGGGREIRPAGESPGTGTYVKPHTWG